MPTPKILVVSHTHWDREWYRTFESFRARLVDLIDRVLELCAADPGFRFHLDGQTIVLDDYLAVRPERREELAAACRAGRIAIGPWWVQPDSLLPGGEAHVRNLLEGRRVGAALGPVSSVAYCPDSFGHPAQFPQLFAGFGLGPFVYWRGHGDEIEHLGRDWTWEAPDGSRVRARHLARGYFDATGLPGQTAAASRFLAALVAEDSGVDTALLMHGFDHAIPDGHVAAVARELATATGSAVLRGTLDDLPSDPAPDGPVFRGALEGGRRANLLPGVWSTRMGLKLRNRACENALLAWAEPFAAIARTLGLADERPALRLAWRALLQNQAHDSIGGCSRDVVHEQMLARYDTALELADETTTRVLERLAGCDVDRRSPWSEAFDVAVFNPSPYPRTDLVRFDPVPREWIAFRGDTDRAIALHPWLRIGLAGEGYAADGAPATVVEDPAGHRIRLLPDLPAHSIEFVARDVPAFGWRRIRLEPTAAATTLEDAGDTISHGDLRVAAAADGTLDVDLGSRRYRGLCALEDVKDRGDTYDHDPDGPGPLASARVQLRRRLEPSGVARLRVTHEFAGGSRVTLEAILVPGSRRVDLEVEVENRECDHRLRLLFPTGAAIDSCVAATTFDVTRRSTTPPEASRWVHPAPTTFAHQGFVAANGLGVAAPGLPEAEARPDGTLAITLVRAVGWLARVDVRTRPEPAGPTMPVPGAQCIGTLSARLALFDENDIRAAGDAETHLRAVTAGPSPLWPPDEPYLAVEPREILVSTVKPAEDGEGLVVRLSNPTDALVHAIVRTTLPHSEVLSVRLDEATDGRRVDASGTEIRLEVPAHGLRSIRVR